MGQLALLSPRRSFALVAFSVILSRLLSRLLSRFLVPRSLSPKLGYDHRERALLLPRVRSYWTSSWTLCAIPIRAIRYYETSLLFLSIVSRNKKRDFLSCLEFTTRWDSQKRTKLINGSSSMRFVRPASSAGVILGDCH